MTEHGGGEDWRSLSDEDLVRRYLVDKKNQFRPYGPGTPVDVATTERISRTLRDRLEQYEQQQEETRRLTQERARQRKLRSDRVKRDRLRQALANNVATARTEAPIGSTKIAPHVHDKFYATLATPHGKYGLDRPVYGQSRADGLEYSLVDPLAQTCSVLRPPSAEGSRGYCFVNPRSASPGHQAYSRTDLLIGCSVAFVETADPEGFRLMRRDAFGPTPPPGQYFTPTGRHDTFSRPATTNSYLSQRFVTPGAAGLPLFGASKTKRVIIGTSFQASMHMQHADGEAVPIGHYFQQEPPAPCTHLHSLPGSPIHARSCAQQRQARLAPDSRLLRSASHIRPSDPDRSLAPGQANLPVSLKEPRGLLPTPEQDKAARAARQAAVAAGELLSHAKKVQRLSLGPRPDASALLPNTQKNEKEYQQSLAERLKVQTEQRFKLTPKDLHKRPLSPLK